MPDETNPPPNPNDQPQQLQRLAFWPNLLASFRHIRNAVDVEGNKMRKTDPLTVWLVPILAVVLVFVSGFSGWLRFGCAVLAYLTVLIYIAVRIGIVRSLSLRQTNMVWHLLLATFLLGILFAFAFIELMHL